MSLYVFLHLLRNTYFKIVNESLEIIDNKIFKIIEIYLNNERVYKVLSNKEILKTSKGIDKTYSLENIEKQTILLLNKILSHKKAKGAFEIKEIQPIIDDLLDGIKLKGSSRVKGDLRALVFDKKVNTANNLKYSIKSNLGASATLFNSSQQTNFIYEVLNINDTIMKKNNLIKTRTKLLDKYNYLKSSGGIFNFIKTESDIFYNNLKLIDTKLDEILAKILLLSYEKNEKDIKKLLSLIITDKVSEIYYKKKISDFANATTFGMFPSKKWNGINEVNGGIIIVTKKGEVYLLDLIYFKNIVDKYLLNNIKLDSPSSKRYGMFHIYKENNKYYFKLNLQVRFK